MTELQEKSIETLEKTKVTIEVGGVQKVFYLSNFYISMTRDVEPVRDMNGEIVEFSASDEILFFCSGNMDVEK